MCSVEKDHIEKWIQIKINKKLSWCWQTRVTQSLVVFVIFYFENAATLKSGSGSLKVIETGSIQQTGYGFLLMFCSIEILSLKTRRFLRYSPSKTGVRGHWRSFKVTLFDMPPMTSYWCSIVTVALCRVVSEIFNVENITTLKSWSTASQGRWNWYHSIDWYGFLLVFHSRPNFVHKTQRFEIFDL